MKTGRCMAKPWMLARPKNLHRFCNLRSCLPSACPCPWPAPALALACHTLSSHLELLDEWHEEVPLQPSLVQLIRVSVGGGHQHHTTLPQMAEQPARGGGWRVLVRVRLAGARAVRHAIALYIVRAVKVHPLELLIKKALASTSITGASDWLLAEIMLIM